MFREVFLARVCRASIEFYWVLEGFGLQGLESKGSGFSAFALRGRDLSCPRIVFRVGVFLFKVGVF